MSLDVKELESKTLKLNFLHIAIQMYYRYVTIDVIFTFIHAQNMQVGHLTLFTLFYVCTVKLVSKELNHFGVIAAFFRYGAWDKLLFMRHLSVSQVPHTGKMLQSPQSDLTPWTLTLIYSVHYTGKSFSEALILL